ncbi:hypothetical protein SARC_17314, partial [Sphaeroforma arctica JP610]
MYTSISTGDVISAMQAGLDGNPASRASHNLDIANHPSLLGRKTGSAETRYSKISA